MPFFIRRRKKNFNSQSIFSITWRKFRKNRFGMGWFVFLCLLVTISLLGYLITPDHTPYCNEQILEIRLLKPGTQMDFLAVKNKQSIDNQNKGWLNTMLFGKPNPYHLIPFTNIQYKDDSVTVTVFNETAPFNRKSFCKEEVVKVVHRTFLLGTDRYGRDMLSQLIIGARVSLSIGFVAVCIALLIGVFIGAAAGYFGGRTDSVILWFINVVWSVPSLLLVIAISFVLGSGFWQVFIAIGLTMWVDVARVVRGQFISLREKEYVEASKALGFHNFTIIFKHILPNITGTLTVISASNFASAILMEAGLSFLGIGVQPPMPSWGNMIKENYGYIILDYAYLAIIPGMAIVLLVLAFMIFGNSLRDAMDVSS
ncbi:MAG: ABC transporter permease [Bacteroidales bacterium]|nr:ABC transporter permease [Bacteroidales bacterium]